MARSQLLCLTANHYHLVVEVPDANLSKGMRQLNGVYTQHFNRRHHRDGPLFQGRFRSVVFEPDTYLLPSCRHVVVNPVRVNLTRSANSYRWSSYRATAGVVSSPRFLCTEVVLSRFGKRRGDSQRKYRDYVKAGIGAASPLTERSNQVLLGSPAFIAEMQPVLNGERMAKRGPKRARRRRSPAGPVQERGEQDPCRAQRADSPGSHRLQLHADGDWGARWNSITRP
ncbi:MAG: addiction module toxin RelE [Gammaproteobacteria bacterium]|nr:addiction module toxin RelE [Gammaproteobacteria bacterium]